LILFFAAIGSYFILLLFSTLFVSKIFSKIKRRTELEEQILFHQINVYNNFFWIPISFIMLLTPGIIVWSIVCYRIYSYNLEKGDAITAHCNWKKIHVNRNSYFENKARIIEIRYCILEKEIRQKTKVPEIVYDQIEEGPIEILTSPKYPKFWVINNDLSNE
jgi:hypothetical protein